MVLLLFSFCSINFIWMFQYLLKYERLLSKSTQNLLNSKQIWVSVCSTNHITSSNTIKSHLNATSFHMIRQNLWYTHSHNNKIYIKLYTPTTNTFAARFYFVIIVWATEYGLLLITNYIAFIHISLLLGDCFCVNAK